MGIKQDRRIRPFFGTLENVEKSRIWIVASVYAIVAIIRKHLKVQESLHTILQIPNLTIFEKIPLNQMLDATELQIQPNRPSKRLNSFDL